MRGDFRKLPRALWVLYLGTIVNRLGTFVFPFLTLYLTEARELGTAAVGQILAGGSLGLLGGNLLGGWLTDHWSRKATLLTALVVNAAGFACLAFPLDPVWLYAVFLFVGYFGSGMFNPAANTLIADLTSGAMRPFAYTVNYVCVNLGMALGPLLGGALAAASYSLLFVGDVVTSLGCAALLLCCIPGARRQELAPQPAGPRPRRSLIAAWRAHPFVFAFCLANFFLIAPLMGLEYSVPLFVKRSFEDPPVFVGVVYTLNALTILCTSFFVERLIRRRNEIAMMVVAGLLWTAGLTVLAVGFSLPALLVCTVVWTLGEVVASILVPTFISRRVAPAVKGRFLALNDATRSLAGVIAPVALGILWEQRGAGAVAWAILAVPAAGTLAYAGLLLYTARRHGRAAWAPQAAAVEQ